MLTHKRELSPKNLILDLLHLSVGQSLTIKDLIKAGRLFGITENAVRVAITRLVNTDVVENDERGRYRLTQQTIPLRQMIDQWRLGAQRTRAWDGSWLSVIMPKKFERTKKSGSIKALSMFNFKEGSDNYHIRPNNLSFTMEQIKDMLSKFGLSKQCIFFVSSQLPHDIEFLWKQSLWPTSEIIKSYHYLLQRIQSSQTKITKMPHQQALIESFKISNEVIYQLNKDPLLPEAIMDNASRAQLTEAMFEYDEIGRDIWKKELPGLSDAYRPGHNRSSIGETTDKQAEQDNSKNGCQSGQE